MLPHDANHSWNQFLAFAKTRCSGTAFGNWLAPIQVIEATEEGITLEIPNLFVKEYLLSNYGKDLPAFLPVRPNGELAVEFVVSRSEKSPVGKASPAEKGTGKKNS